MSRLAGKSAVITGAAKGIGRATADLFAIEGARLVATDIDAAGLDRLRADLESRGAECVTVVGDVSKPDDARRMIEAAAEHYGRLDILVANAGIIPLRTINEATPEDWDEVMSIDGRGMFLTCKYAIEQMVQNGGGSIVCLSSISGIAGQASQSTYGPAKFVASGLTKHLAVEWADRGIRVNAVAPGTRRSRAQSRSSRPTRRRSSPAQSCPSTAVTSRADRLVTRLGCVEARLRRVCMARRRSSVGCRT
jgi:NAD(P)-dependent dehydrogenase (short-subunit alcohol dehydrogenase family)